ncbi:hypothetical protein B296_00044524 [Ensete ventricosum]|uniref:Uncharacterized protein n=1 Tax=Ensete ventricosum TaxID=4639 RepID=A0A426XDY2_ENSVE|nr:hypothetical protein B296_00044524 [Ensete ventricosum]
MSCATRFSDDATSSRGGENDKTYFGPSNICFHVTFQKPSRYDRLNLDQDLGKKRYLGPLLEGLGVDCIPRLHSTPIRTSQWTPSDSSSTKD